MIDTPTKTPEEIMQKAAYQEGPIPNSRFPNNRFQYERWRPLIKTQIAALDAAGYVIVPKDVLAPFLAFASANRGLQLLSDVQMTNGSPMSGPQVYGRDFLALAAAQNEESRQPEG